MTTNPTRAEGELVEAMARALFVHEEGHPVSEETLNYWFSCNENSKGEDLHCKWVCDDLRAKATALLPVITAARRDALEEAAKCAEDSGKCYHCDANKAISAAIRALDEDRPT